MHQERGFGFTSRSSYLDDIRGWVEDGKYGLSYGIPVYRKSDGLWLPLTKVGSMPSLLHERG